MLISSCSFFLFFFFFFFITDNMPVTWCYQLEDERQYCSTGFPMGCFLRDSRSQQDCTVNVNLKYYYFCNKNRKFINSRF